MPTASLDRLLDRLARASRERSPGDGEETVRLLARLGRARFTDAKHLIRFHEQVLFLRAYPHDRTVLRACEALLVSFNRRVERLVGQPDFEPGPFIQPEVSGIAGTSLSIDWSYELARHLAARYPARIDVDWEVEWDEPALTEVLKILSPSFEDGAYVEFPVPSRRWVERVRSRRERSLAWLLRRFERWPIPEPEKGLLFNGMKLYLELKLGNTKVSRTRARVPGGETFCHAGPLLRRSEVSFAEELEKGRPLPVRKLARREGDALLALARDAMAVRSRELQGFNFGDPGTVLRAVAGRGVEIFLWGLPPERRLPLLAYHSALLVKNGVPCGYAESLGFFERTEVGVNLFYSFREGESAWIYARLLRLLRQQLGLTVFSIDPYQIGYHNEEGIESGAFWFYRKLGFRPVMPELERLVLAEEKKLASRPGYRSGPGVLRKLAAGHLLLEAPLTSEPGAWDRFRIGNLGLAAEQRATARLGGDEVACRREAVATVSKRLGLDATGWDAGISQAFSHLAVVLADSPALASWSPEEKHGFEEIIRAKAGPDEARYLKLLQGHPRLRREMLRRGANAQSASF